MNDNNWIKLLAVLSVAALSMTSVMAMPWQFYFTQPDAGDMKFPGVDNETIYEMQQIYEQIQDAIEAGNYTQWRAAMEGLLTEENFQRHVTFHNAQQARAQLMEQFQQAWEDGDYETIAQLREQMQNSFGNQTGMGPGQCNGHGNCGKPLPQQARGNAWGKLKNFFGGLGGMFGGRGR
ncbi:MAG TPA: hypothetical protein ENN60_03815 [archaeon]|nr:hypothetical protein [archaeon]